MPCGPTVYSASTSATPRPSGPSFPSSARFPCALGGYRGAAGRQRHRRQPTRFLYRPPRRARGALRRVSRGWMTAPTSRTPTGNRSPRAFPTPSPRLAVPRRRPALFGRCRPGSSPGHAYEFRVGDVYFKVPQLGDLRQASPNRANGDMDHGEEVRARPPLKQDPSTFSPLWKVPAKPGEDPKWPPPWGPGRPAWHIECSVMADRSWGACRLLPRRGSDLVFFPPSRKRRPVGGGGGGRSRGFWITTGLFETAEREVSKSERQPSFQPCPRPARNRYGHERRSSRY